jgi:diacylglycerol kinase family enzyme
MTIVAERVAALVNVAAGNVSVGDDEALTNALGERGSREVVVFPITEMDAMLEDIRRFDAAVVLGGDGTARTLAGRMPHDGPPLIVLPGGTMNVLPNALNGEGAWQEVLDRALNHGEVGRMTAASANGEVFFLAAMFGAPTILARAREAVRKGRFVQSMQRVSDFFRDSFSRRLSSYPNGGERRDVEAIGVLCAAMFGDPQGEDLEWVHLNANNFYDLARVGIGALGPNWRDDPAVQARRCDGGVIKDRGRIPAILDGEPMELKSPIKIKFVSEGPKVVWVQKTAAAAAA